MSRMRVQIDRDWRFWLQDQPLDDGIEWTKAGKCGKTWQGKVIGPSAAEFDDSKWRTLDLPHDWSVEQRPVPDPCERNGFYPTGVGWYRKTLDIPAADEGRKFFLEFDGIYRNATIFLNGHLVAQNQSGYLGFSCDISEVLNYGGKNVLAVRVDASKKEGWFYEGGGIYRHVWLTRTEPVYVPYCGTFVTSAVQRSAAVVTALTTIANANDAAARCTVVSEIFAPDGKRVAVTQSACTVPAGLTIETTQKLHVAAPALWSLEQRHLYKLITTIKQTGKPVDRCETAFGIRTIRFDANRGFFLNGKHVELKGVCCHQDHAGVGVALPDRLHEYRIEKLKEMGCNAYRCSHHPVSPQLLDICDRLGMLVMDEQRMMGTSAEVLDQMERMFLRDRNHPSIVIWSLGNEEMEIQGTKVGQRILKTMLRRAKRLDTTRPMTVAMNGKWGEGFTHLVDVQGCNYIRIGDADAFHKKFPKLPMVFAEAGSSVTTRGIYEDDADKCFMAAYDLHKFSKGTPDNPWMLTWCHSFEDTWSYIAARPFIAGAFLWTGIDYRGEQSPYNRWPCVWSHFGVMDGCCFPKDNFYYLQAWWGDKPVLHLLPHWNWPDRVGQEIDVWCHTNARSVELFLNGKSQGAVQVKPNSHAAWKVRYEPGELVARGYDQAGRLIATTRVQTTGAPAAITLTPDRRTLHADGQDVSMVTVAVVDDAGRVVPTADNDIAFTIAGQGHILGVGNGHPFSHEPDKASRRRVFNGLAQVIVQTTLKPGPITLTATSPGLRGTKLHLTTKG